MLNILLKEAIVSFPIPEIPEIKQDDNIGDLIAERMEKLGGIEDGDIFVVASKIVSKSEGQVVDFTQITPSIVKEDPIDRELVQSVLELQVWTRLESEKSF